MSESQIRSLARRLRSLEDWRLQSKQPNLGYSTIDGGALQAADDDGQQTMIIGQQFDGTNMPAVVSGPTPPTPSAPIVESIIGALKVKIDGTFADGSVIPMDFARWEIHVSTDPEFIPDLSTTLYATIESPRGGEHAVALPYVPHYVRIVARSLAGKGSSPSAIAGPYQPSFVQTADLDPGIELGGPTGPDGVAPASSPDAVVSPLGIGGILVSWTPITNADPVTYNVYVSTAPITGADPDLLLTQTEATQVAVTSLADGTNIIAGQQIYVRILARDEDGPAVSGLGVEGNAVTRQASNAEISSDFVYAGTVDAAQIQTGSLEAVLAVLGGLTIGDLASKNIRINPSTGFEVVDASGQSIVHFPISTDGINKFVGDLVAQGFTAMGRTQFRGDDNEISMNSVFEMASGVTAPANTVSIDPSYRETLDIPEKDVTNFNTTWMGQDQRFSWNAVEGKLATITPVNMEDFYGTNPETGQSGATRIRIQQIDPNDASLSEAELKFITQQGYTAEARQGIGRDQYGSTVIEAGTPAERATMTAPSNSVWSPGDGYPIEKLIYDGQEFSEYDYGVLGGGVKNTYISLGNGTKTVTMKYGQLASESANGVDTRPTLSKVKIWHFNKDSRRYNTKVEISADGVTWTTVFDSAVSGTYAESAAGKTITFPAQKVLYVRDTLNGSDANGGNHITEIEAWGWDYNSKKFPGSVLGQFSRPVRIGSYWYIAYGTTNADGNYEHRIGKFDTTGQQVAAYDYMPYSNGAPTGGWFANNATMFPALTTDGTDLIVAQYTDAGFVEFQHFAVASGWAAPYKTVTTNIALVEPGTSSTPGAFLYGSFDLGAPHYFVRSGNMLAFDATGVRAPQHDWDSATASYAGSGDVAWNGTRFLIGAYSSGYPMYQTDTSLSTDPVKAAFSWYDSDPAGTGTHETTVGPVATSNRRPRFGVTISTSLDIPSAGDVDSPDSHRLYGYQGTSYASTADLKLLPAVTETQNIFGTIYTSTIYRQTGSLGGTTAPPVANSFPDGFAAEFRSAKGGFWVRGDGTGEWPDLESRVLSSANAAMETEVASALAGLWEPGDLKASAATTTTKPGWLECKGQRVLQADYPDLYAAIGFSNGANLGDGTFPLPDYRKRGIRGADDATLPVGTTGGAETKTLTEANLPPHTHSAGTLATASDGGHSHEITRAGATGGNSQTVARGDSSAAGSANTGTNGAHTHSITGSTGSGSGASTPLDVLDPFGTARIWIKT